MVVNCSIYLFIEILITWKILFLYTGCLLLLLLLLLLFFGGGVGGWGWCVCVLGGGGGGGGVGGGGCRDSKVSLLGFYLPWNLKWNRKESNKSHHNDKITQIQNNSNDENFRVCGNIRINMWVWRCLNTYSIIDQNFANEFFLNNMFGVCEESPPKGHTWLRFCTESGLLPLWWPNTESSVSTIIYYIS